MESIVEFIVFYFFMSLITFAITMGFEQDIEIMIIECIFWPIALAYLIIYIIIWIVKNLIKFSIYYTKSLIEMIKE